MHGLDIWCSKLDLYNISYRRINDTVVEMDMHTRKRRLTCVKVDLNLDVNIVSILVFTDVNASIYSIDDLKKINELNKEYEAVKFGIANSKIIVMTYVPSKYIDDEIYLIKPIVSMHRLIDEFF